jgi:hypothetical protein
MAATCCPHRSGWIANIVLAVIHTVVLITYIAIVIHTVQTTSAAALPPMPSRSGYSG